MSVKKEDGRERKKEDEMSSFGFNRRSHFTGNEFPLSRHRFTVNFALIAQEIMWEL